MVATQGISITKVKQSKLEQLDLDNLGFGKQFSDHMLEVDYADGKWGNVQIRPYQPLSFQPSLSAIHYGQSIFEGIKAFRLLDGNIVIFRPEMNHRRFNISASRMAMPEVPAEIFMDGMRELIRLERNWVPARPNYSLYIRPFMFATDEVIGVKPADTYKFMIILSPSGPLFSAPLRIHVEEQYVRAVEGGVGFAKAAGNYGAAMMVTAEARKKGFDQVLWTDAHTHKQVQEIGVMNVFFVLDNVVYTPGLNQGTILAGITRDSAMTILRDMGLEVREEAVDIDTIIEAHSTGKLKEVFGTGTAATISYIQELSYRGQGMHFQPDSWTVAPELKRRLDSIREGTIPDTHHWLYRID